MRVLHVVDQLQAGGAERVCVDLAGISASHGLCVGILVLLKESSLDESVPAGVKLHYLRRESRFALSAYFRTATICRQYDIIHVHMRHVFRYMKAVSYLSGLRMPMILHDHFGAIELQKQVPFLFRSVFKPSFYVGVSKELTHWASTALGMDTSRVFLLANIVRQHHYDSAKVPSMDLLVVSNIRRTKNIEFAIRLALKLDLRLDVIGQVVDTEYYQELKELIQSEVGGENIRFIHDCYEVQAVLHKYTMALHTATSETGPLVLMEYLAQGLNFLAFQTGEVAETVAPFFPDFFMNDFDLNQWVARIADLRKSPIEPEILKKVFEANFSEDSYNNRCREIYERVRNY